MSEEMNANLPCHDGGKAIPCDVHGKTRTQFPDTPVTPVTPTAAPLVKVPVVLAETTLQVVAEADIPLSPPASEIKRVLKDVVLTQCKLVPVAFESNPVSGSTNLFRATRGKLFVEGYIRKNIEYASSECNGVLHDRIANVRFSGFADLNGSTAFGGDFISFPVFALSGDSAYRFINPKNGDSPRLDKYLFSNNVFYNEQPYCELVSADFFEYDYSPFPTEFGASFRTLKDKVVLDLTLKVLQVQQVKIPKMDYGHHC